MILKRELISVSSHTVNVIPRCMSFDGSCSIRSAAWVLSRFAVTARTNFLAWACPGLARPAPPGTNRRVVGRTDPAVRRRSIPGDQPQDAQPTLLGEMAEWSSVEHKRISWIGHGQMYCQICFAARVGSSGSMSFVQVSSNRSSARAAEIDSLLNRRRTARS